MEVSIGEVKGFVPHHHISDTLLQNPFAKFKLHSKIKAKVIHLDFYYSFICKLFN